jgi:hypothetical protein
MSDQVYGLATFRSRQHAIAYAQQLQRSGIHADLITTPRTLSIGCGVSVKIPARDMSKLPRQVNMQQTSLVGYYVVDNNHYIPSRY